jgi:hypothetical protein
MEVVRAIGRHVDIVDVGEDEVTFGAVMFIRNRMTVRQLVQK